MNSVVSSSELLVVWCAWCCTFLLLGCMAPAGGEESSSAPPSFMMFATAFVVTTTHNSNRPSRPRSVATTRRYASPINTSFMWNAGLNFGKGDFKFYPGFDEYMKPFPEEDRLAFPDMFNLPAGAYEVKLTKPLGIIFEEIETGRGLYVQDLVPGGAADVDGRVKPGDVLVGITAVKIVGAKYERRLIPARRFDFDTMVGAVASNDPKWGCDDVVLMFERPGEADPPKVDAFLEFFEPPFDNPWKQRQ